MMSEVFCKSIKNILKKHKMTRHNLIGVKNHPEFYLNLQQMCEEFLTLSISMLFRESKRLMSIKKNMNKTFLKYL